MNKISDINNINKCSVDDFFKSQSKCYETLADEKHLCYFLELFCLYISDFKNVSEKVMQFENDRKWTSKQTGELVDEKKIKRKIYRRGNC